MILMCIFGSAGCPVLCISFMTTCISTRSFAPDLKTAYRTVWQALNRQLRVYEILQTAMESSWTRPRWPGRPGTPSPFGRMCRVPCTAS